MVSTILLINFGWPPLEHTIKTSFITFQIVDLEILIFFKRVWDLLLHLILCMIFLLLYFINWPDFIFWLPLLTEILNNICIVITCCLVCDVINFENNLRFIIKPFFYITKSQDKSLNISSTKKAFHIK